MSREPRYLMTRKDIAKYVDYVNRGASEDSKDMFLHQFKFRDDTEHARNWESVKRGLKVYYPIPLDEDDRR